MARIACYTLTWNRLAFTKKCFSTMYEKAGVKFDHYIVDNGSDDGTSLWLRKKFYSGQFKGIILNNQNMGIIYAQNQLWQTLCNYDYIIRTDNDVIYESENWLLRTLEVSNKLGDKCVLCPRIRGLVKPLIGYNPVKILNEIVYHVNSIGGFWFVPLSLWLEYKLDFSNRSKHSFSDFNGIIEIAKRKNYLLGMIKDVVIFHDSLNQPKVDGKYNRERELARKELL